MPGCSVSFTTKSFCSVVNRRRRATLVMTSTFENVSDIGVLGLYLAPPAKAGVRPKRGAVHPLVDKRLERQSQMRPASRSRAGARAVRWVRATATMHLGRQAVFD